MQNKKKNRHIEQPDDFSLQIREKLDDYKMSVDTDIWDNIESRIAPSPQKTWMRWVSSAAAVAAIIGIILFIIPDREPLLNMANTYQDTSFIFPEKKYHQAITGNSPEKPDRNSSISAQYSKQTISHSTERTENVKNSDNNNEKETEKDNSDQNKETESPTNKEIKKEENTQPEEPAYNRQKSTRKQPEPPILLDKRPGNGNWLLAASMSSTNGASSGINVLNSIKNSSYDPDYLANEAEEPITLKDPGNANTEILSSKDFTNIDHDIPLSFGITVRKDFNERIGLETGLTYTYLSSTMERANVPQYKAKQELHYLGIPVNVVVYLWNNPKWNIYLSGGGMIEKGLRQKYVQDMYQSDVMTSSISDKGSISGVQFSLNASAGASYAFYNNFSLYVEPRFSYYFDNDQPLSVRTEKQSVFGIGGGLRYKF